MRDWLLRRFEDETGKFSEDELAEFVRKFIPRKDDWTAIKNRIIKENERVKFLAKISVDIDIRTGEVSFTLPDFGLTAKQTIIEDLIWDSCKEELVNGRESWGMLELGYRLPDDSATPKQPGKIRLVNFKSFCPYSINLDYYKNARSEFKVSEWIDVLLRSIGMEPDQLNEREKWLLLLRLVPLVENNYNLCENKVFFVNIIFYLTLSIYE